MYKFARVRAVLLCALQGILNRDVTLENTLMSGNHYTQPYPLIKLCDFGFSKNERLASLAHSLLGTSAYLAPEVKGAVGYLVLQYQYTLKYYLASFGCHLRHCCTDHE